MQKTGYTSPGDRLYAQAARQGIPLGGTFELSPLCNFKCKMCYIRHTGEQLIAAGQHLIPWQEWLALGEECAREGLLFLLLTGGEPFAYPHFRELYEGLHDLHILLSINTNGSLIGPETVAWLRERAPRRVNLTLYGASRETYGRVCGCPEGYDRAVRAVRLLREAGIPVVLNLSLIPDNQADMEQLVALAGELGVNIRVNPYMFPPVRREREETDTRFAPEEVAEIFLRHRRLTSTSEAYATFLRDTAKIPEEAVAAGLTLPDLTGGGTAGSGHLCSAGAEDGPDWGAPDVDVSETAQHMVCRAGKCNYWVAWDGSMTACGMTAFPAKVYPFRDGFATSWARLREAVQAAPVLAGCRDCGLRQVCHPCVAMLDAETGDVNRPAPYLCALASRICEVAQEEMKGAGI